ncbi:MAG TPA: FtsX-like permease family protein [Candidatus Chromulinivoraceae bacterium]|nr:FtsX-like permease family protein [Candidatus Chromulinivoraceae bacterium]
MNVLTRGMRNALRSPIRSGAILIMLAISISLILAMMVARTSVNNKVAEVKASTATQVTINPAGISGGMGGGDPLTADQIKTIASTAHVKSVASTLTDQLGTSDTNLTPSLELGSFGKRMMRFESADGSSGASTNVGGGANDTSRPAPTPRTTVTGTSDPASIVATDKITSGATIDGSSSDLIALVGTTLAQKNSLSAGSTFTAYGKTITVKGIFTSDNKFENNGIIMPIATLQTLTNQPGSVTNVTATIDSSDNVASAVTALKASLGDKADITSQQQQAENSLQPLESIASLALVGVIGASVAAAAIILLSMIMIVRERRREIGVIKAIGGTNAKVIVQFVTEALTLTILGGILGLGIGVMTSGPLTQSLVSSSTNSNNPQTVTSTGGGARRMSFGGGFGAISSQLGSNVKDVTSTLTPQILAESVGIIILIAIVGSAVPAWAIARVRPAEVLRTE